MQLIQTIVWPVTIVTLAVLLRRSLANLITRFQEGEFPGVKVKFIGEHVEAHTASDIIFRTILEAGTGNVAELDESDSEIRLIFMLASERAESDADKKLSGALLLTGTNPTAAILSCAAVLETAVKIIYGWRFVSPPGVDRKGRSVTPEAIAALDTLFKEGFLAESIYRNAKSMFEFRDKVLNGKITDGVSAAIFLDTGRFCLTSVLISRYFFENREVLTDKGLLVVRHSRGKFQEASSDTGEGGESEQLSE